MAYTFETRCPKCREDIFFEIDGEDINQTLNLECLLCGNNFERKISAEYVHYGGEENIQDADDYEYEENNLDGRDMWGTILTLIFYGALFYFLFFTSTGNGILELIWALIMGILYIIGALIMGVFEILEGIIGESSDEKTLNEVEDAIDETVSVADEGCPDGFFEDVKKYDEKLEECETKKDLYLTSEEWSKLKSLSLECKEHTLNAISNLNNLKSDTDSNECLNEISADIIYQKAQESRWEYAYHLSYLFLQGKDWDNHKLLSYLDNTVKPKMSDTVYYIYIMKKKYPQYYPVNENSIEQYKQINQGFNQIYDEYYNDPNAKYFLQVNPNDPTVIYQTDKLTEGLGGDDDKISLKIFEFVRDNIEYKHDPNWKTDWVQSPSLTLFSGEGDCDDHAVLLASMFMRAGMSDVKLCFSDDHAWISAEGYGWDATCKNCEKSAPDGLKGKCHEINKYLRYLENV